MKCIDGERETAKTELLERVSGVFKRQLQHPLWLAGIRFSFLFRFSCLLGLLLPPPNVWNIKTFGKRRKTSRVKKRIIIITNDDTTREKSLEFFQQKQENKQTGKEEKKSSGISTAPLQGCELLTRGACCNREGGKVVVVLEEEEELGTRSFGVNNPLKFKRCFFFFSFFQRFTFFLPSLLLFLFCLLQCRCLALSIHSTLHFYILFD